MKKFDLTPYVQDLPEVLPALPVGKISYAAMTKAACERVYAHAENGPEFRKVLKPFDNVTSIYGKLIIDKNACLQLVLDDLEQHGFTIPEKDYGRVLDVISDWTKNREGIGSRFTRRLAAKKLAQIAVKAAE